MNAENPGPQDLVADVPAFAALARTAVLLRPTAGDPGPRDSSVGGPLLWPVDEAWPLCGAPHLVERRERLTDHERELWEACDRRTRERRRVRGGGASVMSTEDARTLDRIMDGAGSLDMITWERVRTLREVPAVPTPMVPVLQLRARDVPGLRLPDGTDLLQLLWCPEDHAELPGQPRYWGPHAVLRHRAEHTVGAVLDTPPRPAHPDENHLPRPCLLDPVEVLDLPDRDELPGELVGTAHAWAEEHGTEYARRLACLPGWKAGGWPSWHLTDLVPVDCAACGTRTRLLLTLDSGRDPDLLLGRSGEIRVFTCPTDPTHPFRLNTQ
ncbi:hypothetical protein ACIQCR_12305 [Streptomyces sp. NPDC093249]|uniref:hypothetical protein n=1 Tax=unclassified Streptomyces TaxID=2593676 RepID=UPI00382939C1